MDKMQIDDQQLRRGPFCPTTSNAENKEQLHRRKLMALRCVS